MATDTIDRKIAEQTVLKTLTTLFTRPAADIKTRLAAMPDVDLERLQAGLDAIVGRSDTP